MKKHKINPKKQKTVRKLLRNYPTPWEQKLWNQLKGKQLDGFKFRRQQGIENNVVDFYCPEVKLIVELDGSGHLSAIANKADQERDEALNTFGYHILRFYNNEVDKNLDGVLNIISDKCKELRD
ncbi:MAG: endonuclease domain-containing protein [Candidatus Marinimicrobia bacterium]|nr:endonuclease domain-containing protein [Candidatus Neomarinimicrobiota bacterium]MCH7762602.1 endonuclease domain-containing protein [Candidatus Neomarinimicrobiota bacterium]